MSLFHRFRKDKQRGTKKQNMVQRVGNHLRICLDILDGCVSVKTMGEKDENEKSDIVVPCTITMFY